MTKVAGVRPCLFVDAALVVNYRRRLAVKSNAAVIDSSSTSNSTVLGRCQPRILRLLNESRRASALAMEDLSSVRKAVAAWTVMAFERLTEHDTETICVRQRVRLLLYGLRCQRILPTHICHWNFRSFSFRVDVLVICDASHYATSTISHLVTALRHDKPPDSMCAKIDKVIPRRWMPQTFATNDIRGQEDCNFCN